MYFQRGTLTPEQTRLVLRDLPVDVSFADENDVLVYWSGPTYKTCDARYIGRDVRDCHPESTLECLEEILREFKAGTKDVAEGWKQDGKGASSTRATRRSATTPAPTRASSRSTTTSPACAPSRARRRLPGW